MKAVLISIKPEWCDLITRGEKTLEVRKGRPKLETPFKCYIYRTKGTVNHIVNDKCVKMQVGGTVIAEFICDSILLMSIKYSNPNSMVALKEFPGTCLTEKQIIDYLGNGVIGYGWHISDLKIYEKPKELSEFYNWKKCNSCRKSGYESSACIYDEDCMVPAVITRPPQSWFYVEG